MERRGGEKKEKWRGGGQVLTHARAYTHTHTYHTCTCTQRETFTRSADRSISSRLRAGESLAMVLSVFTGLKMEASSTTIDREVQSGGRG